MSRGDADSARPRFHVEGPDDWEVIAELTADFHDAVVREVALVGDEYLNADYILKMTAEVGARVRLLVHIQRREVPAMELEFHGVSEVAYSATEQFDPARCYQAPDGLLVFEVASTRVKARTCDATPLGVAALGAEARLSDL